MAAILIATADSSLATLLLAEFGGEGHAVSWALDGREAVELALEHAPDMVFLDHTLEWVSTRQVCETLRNHTGVPAELPIILLSDEPLEARTLDKMRATERLPKSHSLAELRELLTRYLT